MKPQQKIPEVSLLRLPEVIARTGLSRSQIYRMIGAGDFPRPIRLTPRTSGWISSDVDDWIQARIANARKVRQEAVDQ